MLNKFFYICISFFLINQTLSAYNHSSFAAIDCVEELKPSLSKILEIDDARELIESINKEGMIHIVVNKHQLSEQFGAYWDMTRRTICVSGSSSTGQMIGSIIFELCNAAANSRLDKLDELASRGQIDCETYVKAVERIEFENSLIASKIAQQGIDRGIFPKEAFLPTYANFEEHYRYQKIGGHSVWIERNYYKLIPYHASR